jgi:hypothetical protein
MSSIVYLSIAKLGLRFPQIAESNGFFNPRNPQRDGNLLRTPPPNTSLKTRSDFSYIVSPALRARRAIP